MSHIEYTPKTVRQWALFQQYYDAFWQTVENGAVRMSARTDNTAQTFYYGLRVPPGKRLIVYSRKLKVREGYYEVDVVVPSEGFTGGTLAVKSKLNPKGGDTVSSNLYAGVTPVGTLDVKDQDFIDTGVGIGAGSAGGAPDIDEVVAIIYGESCLRVVREAPDETTYAIRLIAWEEDDPDA